MNVTSLVRVTQTHIVTIQKEVLCVLVIMAMKAMERKIVSEKGYHHALVFFYIPISSIIYSFISCLFKISMNVCSQTMSVLKMLIVETSLVHFYVNAKKDFMEIRRLNVKVC